MLAMTAVIVVLVYRLAVVSRDHFTGVLAAELITTASQFLDTMLEFRPDVPVSLCFLTSLVLAIGASRAGRWNVAAVTFILSGLALGGALMFKQKSVFVLPGFRRRAARVCSEGLAQHRRTARADLSACGDFKTVGRPFFVDPERVDLHLQL